jgi:predicted transcriptional regulator
MPTNDEIDDRLKQLAIAAKNHQSRTWGRQQAMTKLITEIEKYKNINCPQTTNLSSENN